MDNSDCKTESRFPVQKLAYRMESNCVPIHQRSNNDPPNWGSPIIHNRKMNKQIAWYIILVTVFENCNWNVFLRFLQIHLNLILIQPCICSEIFQEGSLNDGRDQSAGWSVVLIYPASNYYIVDKWTIWDVELLSLSRKWWRGSSLTGMILSLHANYDPIIIKWNY